MRSLFTFGTSRMFIILAAFSALVNGNALELDDKTLGDHANFSKHTLVMFYAPWCGHCKAMKPAYNEAAAHFSGIDDVTVAMVDADKHSSVATKYNIEGFPTVHFFEKGNDKHEEYEGGRKSSDIISFLIKKTGVDPSKVKKDDDKKPVDEVKEEVKDTNRPLPDLDYFDDDTLEKHVNDGTIKRSVLVLFMSEGAGDDWLYKEMQKTKLAFEREPHVTVAAVDVAKAPNLKSKYGITSIPHIKLFKYGETEPDFTVDFEEEEKSADRLVEHVNDYAGTFRTEGGDLHEHAGLVLEFEQFSRRIAMEKVPEERQRIAEEAEKLADTVPLRNIHYYKDVFQSYLKDPEYIKNELERLEMEAKKPSSPRDAQDWTTMRRNILESTQEVFDHVKNGGQFTEEELGLNEPSMGDLGIDFESMGIDIDELMKKANLKDDNEGEADGDPGAPVKDMFSTEDAKERDEL